MENIKQLKIVQFQAHIDRGEPKYSNIYERNKFIDHMITAIYKKLKVVKMGFKNVDVRCIVRDENQIEKARLFLQISPNARNAIEVTGKLVLSNGHIYLFDRYKEVSTRPLCRFPQILPRKRG